MNNIWFEYKYQSIGNILNEIQNNSIFDYWIIAASVIASLILCLLILPFILVKTKENKDSKEKKRKKDKLKYLMIQNEIQTEIENRFAEEDRKEIEERINRLEN